MFQIFNKKLYLVDHLENFVDIHNHILPGIDDGAKTVEDSIALLQGFSEFGVHRFIATPHIMHSVYPNTHDTIRNALRLLRDEVTRLGMEHISITAAAEHMVDANFESLLIADKTMPMHSDYLLIEMSYLQASLNFDDAVQKIASKRLFPILAHPERYNYISNGSGVYNRYKEKGILMQLNMLSLGTYYGTEVQKKALRLLDEKKIDFLASDVHNLQQLENLKELKVSRKVLEKILPIIDATIYNFY